MEQINDLYFAISWHKKTLEKQQNLADKPNKIIKNNPIYLLQS